MSEFGISKEITEFMGAMDAEEEGRIYGFSVILRNTLLAPVIERKVRRGLMENKKKGVWPNTLNRTVKRPLHMPDTVVVYDVMNFGTKFRKEDDFLLRQIFGNCYCVYDEQTPKMFKLLIAKNAPFEEFVKVKDRRREIVFGGIPEGELDTRDFNVVK